VIIILILDPAVYWGALAGLLFGIIGNLWATSLMAWRKPNGINARNSFIVVTIFIAFLILLLIIGVFSQNTIETNELTQNVTIIQKQFNLNSDNISIVKEQVNFNQKNCFWQPFWLDW